MDVCRNHGGGWQKKTCADAVVTALPIQAPTRLHVIESFSDALQFVSAILDPTARDKARSVSSGSSLYSCERITWASTLVRSDFKVRREERFFTVVGLSETYPSNPPTAISIVRIDSTRISSVSSAL